MKNLFRFLLLVALLPLVAQAGGWVDSMSMGTLGFKTQGSAPSSPASGYDWLYILTSDGKLYSKDSSGTAHLIPFSGAIVNADLSGSAGITNANLATMANSTIKCRTTSGTGAPEDCTGAQVLAITGGLASPLTTLGDILYENSSPAAARLAGNTTSTKKFLSQTGTGSVSAAPAWAQPAFTDITGTAAASQLPNPGASTLGGIESYASVSHQWLKAISTSGVPSSTQPACADLSDGATSCSTDTTNAANISSGTLPAARLPFPTVSSLGGIQVDTCLAHSFTTAISTSGTLTCTQPSFSDVSGTLGLSAGGTGQTTAAAAFTSLYESKATTLGDLVYGGASGAPTRLAGDTSNTRKFLREVSSGAVAAAPAWDTLLAADVPTLNQNTTGSAGSLSATFGSGVPLFGQGTGVPTVGTVTGNTTKVATSTGSLTSGDCAKWDASGNIIDSGAACGGGGSSVLSSFAVFDTTTGTPYASTNTNVRNFSNVNVTGSDLTCANSATLGSSCTVNTAGTYCIYVADFRSGGAGNANIAINQTSFSSTGATGRYLFGFSGSDFGSGNVCLPLSINDVVRELSDSSNANGTGIGVRMVVTRVN